MWIHKVLIAANILFIHLSVSSFFFFFFFLTKWLLFFVKVIISDATTLYTCHWTEYCFCTLYLHLPVGMKPSPACDRIHTAHLYTLTCNALLRLKFGERYLEKVFKSVKCKCLIPVVTLFVMKPRAAVERQTIHFTIVILRTLTSTSACSWTWLTFLTPMDQSRTGCGATCATSCCSW